MRRVNVTEYKNKTKKEQKMTDTYIRNMTRH